MLFSFGVSSISAQGENDNWYFGNKAAINFSNYPPTAISNSAMNTYEACGSVSDKNGKLLFYASPEKIWNRQNQPMPNGSLVSYMDTAQQLAIVKNPANDNQYYVFTTGVNGIINNSYRISYTIVDMSAGNIGTDGSPLGDVLPRFKQIPVLDDVGNLFYTEAITIIPHPDGESFWVLIPNDKRLYAYRLDANGLDNGNPVISNLDAQISGNHYGIKVSPRVHGSSFSNYVCISPWADTYVSFSLPDSYFTNLIYSFDATAGKITSDFSLHVNALRTYSAEFNKDASVLFLGAKDIYAVDLNNSNSSSVQSMMIYDDPQPYNMGTGMAIQRNILGDIYVSRNFELHLAQITKPNVYGPSIGVDLNAIHLGGASTTSGLPQIIPMLDQSDGYRFGVNSLALTPKNSKNQKGMVLNLDMEERKSLNNQIDIHPNPASTFVNINSGNEKITSWQLFDISGKNVLNGTSNQVNVQGLPKAMYLLKININNKITTKKVIVK